MARPETGKVAAFSPWVGRGMCKRMRVKRSSQAYQRRKQAQTVSANARESWGCGKGGGWGWEKAGRGRRLGEGEVTAQTDKG